jgi:ferrous iron transport protein B
MIRVALVGQPNCGKSALFNSVAGYKAIVSNFPGTTIEYLSSHVLLNGDRFDLIDLPGIYSLSSPESEELVSRRYLLHERPDVIINIMDASVLSRSLELTLELLDLQIPMVVCLNMMDEAQKKGIQIDVEHLSQDLGVPVISTIAIRGSGVTELFKTTLDAARSKSHGKIFSFSQDVEDVVSEIGSLVHEALVKNTGSSRRFLSLKFLEQDKEFEDQIFKAAPALMPALKKLRQEISDCRGKPADVAILSERHAMAMNLFEHVAKVRPRKKRPVRMQVDKYIMHPVLGYVLLAGILFSLFVLVFGFGKELEAPLLAQFEKWALYLNQHMEKGTLFSFLMNGLIQGFTGGIGIVLPYLIPFLIGLSLLEDIGYLPRAAFLMDAIMHRIGLHGKSVIPFVLSYGCNVPAIMATRILEKPRDRYITAVLSTLIPCAARTTIIFAIIGFYLGPVYALGLYLFNILVIAAAGKVLSLLMPEPSPGLVLEIPSYRLPTLSALCKKTWFRLREFIVIAWPLLIAGSLILSLLEYFRLSGIINGLLSPLVSTVLGLPEAVGITLIFGILRKELTLIMLVQALGSSDFSAIMSHSQMLVFTVFSLFYIPCLATLGMLRSVIGIRGMLLALIFTTGLAVLISLFFRIVPAIF